MFSSEKSYKECGATSTALIIKFILRVSGGSIFWLLFDFSFSQIRKQ